MQKQPTVVGLKVCHEAIVAEKTRNVTLVNCFRELTYSSFPATARSFVACAVLTDGQGRGRLTLKVTEPEDLNEIWVKSWQIHLDDPLKEVWYLLPVGGCVFDRAGRHQIELWVDGEHLARTVVRINQKGA